MSYKAGWDAYTAERPLAECETDIMRQGWMAANAAEAACLVVDYMFATGQAAGVSEFIDSLRAHTRVAPGIEDDYEWIRRGC